MKNGVIRRVVSVILTLGLLVPMIAVPSSIAQAASPAISYGDRVAVTEAGDDVAVRPSYSTGSGFIRYMPAGYEGEVIGGPAFNEGYKWWRIHWVTGDTGWTAEASLGGIAYLQPLPGTGFYPSVTHGGLEYRVRVYDDIGTVGLRVRTDHSLVAAVKAKKYPGDRGWTTTDGPYVSTSEELVWWYIVWDDGTTGWSVDSRGDIEAGVYLVKEGSRYPDTTTPTVSISSPSNGQTFTTSTITVSGTASDNVAVSKVEVKVGSGSWMLASGTTSWSKSVTLSPGSNTIYAKAIDTSGNPSSQASVTVNYNPPDTTAPTVSISSPSNGQTFTTSTITVSGTASDNVGVSKVEVRVGSGSWVLASGTTSWSKLVTLSPGSNTIYAKAIDTSGNPSSQASVTVNYDDSPPISDQEKQQQILDMVNSHRGSIPAELVLAVIRQEGGAGAFYVEGWKYNSFYRQNDAPWAQPTNGDGIMQVTAASGYHETSGPYTHDRDGYDHAIVDGYSYLSANYNTYGSYVQTTLHYNTGPNSLYIYLGRNGGDRNYLSHVAGHLSSFVPNIYDLQNAKLANALNQGQSILNDYLYNRGIAVGQSVGYYTSYQTQLDKDLHDIGTSPTGDNFQYPVEGYAVNNAYYFGQFIPTDDYPQRYHLAEDIIKPAGTKVYACADGIVKLANNVHTGAGNYGGLIIIEHTLANGEKVCSLYGHLDDTKTLVRPDSPTANVKRGQQIGEIGRQAPNINGGYVPHLHFGMRCGAFPGEYASDPYTTNGWYWAGYGTRDPRTKTNWWVKPSAFIRDHAASWVESAAHSPVELRVWDSQERVTGMVNGEVRGEIPDSCYCENTITILYPSDLYRYEVVGVGKGSYALTVTQVKEATSEFNVTNMATSTGAVHGYIIDWDALSQGEEGVTIEMDSDGDGDFEGEIHTSQPNAPSSPSPANHATGVSIKPDLSWSGGDPDLGDTVTYDVYFGTSETSLLKQTIGPYPGTQSSITYGPGTLVDGASYYWQIVARDNHGITREGPVWEFTVGQPGPTVTWDLPWGLDPDPASVNIWTYPEDAMAVTLADVDSSMPSDLLIWHYGGPVDGWQFYKKGWGAVNTLETLTPGKGYIGIVPTATVWEIPQA